MSRERVRIGTAQVLEAIRGSPLSSIDSTEKIFIDKSKGEGSNDENIDERRWCNCIDKQDKLNQEPSYLRSSVLDISSPRRQYPDESAPLVPGLGHQDYQENDLDGCEAYTDHINSLQDLLIEGREIILYLSKGYKSAATVDYEWREKIKEVVKEITLSKTEISVATLRDVPLKPSRILKLRGALDHFTTDHGRDTKRQLLFIRCFFAL
ncbi:hypothetical protein EVAR_79862_1 [Eumeta japonica]|uniref:Uncharacterized protein n=1 Tax=Eumeta variegata TaxID=151549 RepID=A0A4C1TYX0_EUMVA|nr:hypothetical protein EVAR_79862_1 [Eumeta japonica]